VSRPPLPVTLVPDDVLLDRRIGPLAFRVYVLLHAETQAHLLHDERKIARALDVFVSALDEAFRELERAGYLVRTLGRDWQLVR
jgi:hypothetical protein